MTKESQKYVAIPIPTYEEATSSRPHSSQPFQGSGEVSDDAERQGLLGAGQGTRAGRLSTRDSNYQRPIAETTRDSFDSDFTLPEVTDDEAEELRHDMEQMDIAEPGSQTGQPRRRGGLLPRFPKRIANLGETFTSWHLPSLPVGFPTIRDLTSRLPQLPDHIKPSFPMLARVIALLMVLTLVYGLVVMRVFTWRSMPMGQQYSPESVRSFVQAAVDKDMIEKYLYEVSFDDHVAGTKGDFFLAEWVEEKFREARLDGVFTEE